jgi:hypothetical protein
LVDAQLTSRFNAFRAEAVRRPRRSFGAAEPDKRQSPSPAVAQLQELADQELAQVRERHKARDNAIRRYDTAAAAVADAEQAEAIATLLATGLDVSAIATVLQLDPRRVREIRSAKRTAGPATALAG